VTLARGHAVTLSGVVGHVVQIEVDVAVGVPAFTLTGLPDTSLSEARDRVRAAVVNSGEPWPSRRVTVNLSPASLRKHGSGFDLALAITCLAAHEQLPAQALDGWVMLGELGLDGGLRPVRGVLPAVMAAVEAGLTKVAVPAANAAEAALVPNAQVVSVATLSSLLDHLRATTELPRVLAPALPEEAAAGPDLRDVAGQLVARQAIEIAAAGGHHVFLHGPPGAGKTLLAERLPGLLPSLEPAAQLEVTAVHSVAGELPDGRPLVTSAPFRAPHHTASAAALVGGGSSLARPGAVSLAHRGVLFLDEAPEFGRASLDALRQPLENGVVTLSRSAGTVTYPARFQLVLAANPCPCGLATTGAVRCTCSPIQRIRYLGRLSGPLLDRVDLRVPVQPVSRADLFAAGAGESSSSVRTRVLEARERASRRLANTPWLTNAEVPGPELRRRFRPAEGALLPLAEQLSRRSLTARGVDRVLRVSWTVADLAGVDQPGAAEVAVALALRGEVPAWAA
jgi:magnesium chelatase family protein